MTHQRDIERLRVTITGAVQGVGFRPFVHRLATSLDLAGSVWNTAQGVIAEVEGPRAALERFLLRIEPEKPAPAVILSLEPVFLDPVGLGAFAIGPSAPDGPRTTLILPDLATCAACAAEVRDPANRRYRYPFTNCTHCGPRFSIILGLPYDRPNTTMRGFTMCSACQAEYDDPQDRRFHAQPNACPACGPAVALWRPDGAVVVVGDAAVRQAGEAIAAGLIVAAKGLGGFHLLVDARSEHAVRRLRDRKRREEKPLAVLAPSLAWLQDACAVDEMERRLLTSPQAPIVLLRRTRRAAVAASVAPGNPHLGVMLPYTPLHRILLDDLGFPVVATSGNVSDEPICTDEREALDGLGAVADLLLVHNRPMARHVDDSVARVVVGHEMVLRRARGYAPLPVPLRAIGEGGGPTLAVGAHLKNAPALRVGERVFTAQHVGDLETPPAVHAFRRVVEDLQRLYGVKAEEWAADLHPDYFSTREARRHPGAVAVQHHLAHVLACAAENEVPLPFLGVAWDGTGLGLDGTAWGGEFLLVTEGGWSRVAHLRPFRLPGGDRAAREPRRAAVGVLYELMGRACLERDDLAPVAAFSAAERRVLAQALDRGVNAPVTTAAGRLFDAVASLAGVRQVSRYEGQAAMELEWAADPAPADGWYNLVVEPRETKPLLVDWGPMIGQVLDDTARSHRVGDVSARFHAGLAEAILTVALRIGAERVALSGGCFQNRLLTELTDARLRTSGLRPYWHQRIPPNDGGIAVGQAVAAARGLIQE